MIMDTQTMPIAIIGIGCRFPGQADMPEKLWDLCAAARNTWSPWPKERLNEKSFTHPQPEHLGTFHSEGGHFLDEDPGRWDASFFNFTADMAKAMDPQIRLLLETTFEAFQTAGLTLERIAGSETAVFAGSMFRDYHDIVMSDPDNLPRYHVTGNAAAFTANRLSHFFDLRGPSVSVDTACSTTMAALHLACQSLRSGESCMAVVGGANLILHPGSSMSLSNLGLTGKSGRSYSFDKQAEGYGRGEGIASIILKPLVNALADGDPVRAVIRETGMNQDGKTPTITTPSSEAQQRLIYSCYARAGLDPGDTIYVEAHGTGTSAGDGVELRVLGNTLGCKRSHETPLYVGSVKANFGHTESTSGLAAIIKVVMMLEHGQIPPQALFTQGNPHIDFAGLNIKIPTELMLWPDGCMRRASINNFGAGGTNTHVIIEDARYLLQGSYDVSLTSQSSASSLGTAWSLEPVGAIARGSEVPEEPLTETETKPQPRRQVFILSARNESGLEETVHKLVDLLDNTSHRSLSLSNLAYTLNERRTHFSWRMAIGASSQAELLNVITDGRPLMKPVKALTASPLRLGFVFTGQGAQWHAMGRELFAVYPVYTNALQDAERCLQNLGAEWNLIEELGRSKEDSRLDLPYLSFPVTVILQLALVLLLGSWGIVPSAATGHSSGEIAAAFAAGGLQFHEAITIAYIRGKLTHNLVQTGLARGKMMAVAVSKVKAAEYIAKTGTETAVVVACVNSPSSVTLSGDAEALDKIEILAQDDNVLSRLLRVPAAYHSPEMETIAEDYLVGLATHLQGATDHSFKANFSSPVTGGLVSDVSSIREPSHWVRNMTQPVQFDDCLRAMIFGGSTPGSASAPKVDVLVEIGPHGTLQSPIHQILESMGQRRLKEHVITCLRRGEDAVKTMQDLAVFVYCRGGHVDLAQVNNPDALGNPTGRTVVHNAPLYPWDNEIQYWGTPTAINDYMQRPHVRHDILGARIEGISGETAVWCNKLRLADLPWVQHHVVQSEILFPAAGLIAMVTEAMRQLDGKATYAYEVRKVDLAVAVVIPKTQEPIEIQLVIRSPFSQSPNGDEALAEKEFAFYSHTAGSSSWTLHCRGKVGRSIQQPEAMGVQDSLSLLPMDVKRFYKFVEQTGPRLGPRFQNISRLAAGDFMAEGTITVPDILAIAPSPGASTYMLHLLILETCIHAAWAALSGTAKRNMGISVPRTIQHLFISPYIPSLAGTKLGLTVNVVREDAGGFAVCVSAFDCNDPDRLPLIQIDGLTIVRIADAVAPVPGDELMLLETVWAPSLDLLSPGDLRLHTRATAPAAEQETFRELLQATYNVIHDHLSWLTPDVEAGLEWYQKKYVSWMRAQDAAFYAAHAVPNNGDRRELYARVEASCVDGRLLAIVSKHLQSFLRREANPLEVLMRDGFLSEYYAHMIKMNRCLGHVKAYMHLFAHTYPGSRVLEIGAGVGSCTEPALQGLMAEQQPGDRASHYTFTDISAGFFEPAARRFAAYADYMTFQKLNIERDPVAQGLIPGAYDLVLSCNCLHATRSLVQTLKYARTLLRPGGKLVLVETTTPHVDQSLAFGLFPGWWLSEEPERADSPLVSAAEWGRYLAAAGFGGLDVVLGDAGEDGDSTYSVMIATAVEETVASISGPRKTIDFAPFPPGIDVPTQDFKSLQAALDSSMGSDLCYFDAAVSSRTKESTVVILSTGISTLSDLTTDQFDNLKALTLSASKVLWVSRGVAIDTPNPWAALCIGLLRTLRLEYGHNRYVSLDLDPAQDIWHADSVKAICAVLRLMEDDRICEYEFAVRKGEVLVPRLRRYAMQNKVEARMASGERGLGVTTTPAFSLNAGGAYLVVGGLTGIGREVVRWLAREGARYVIAISRRGPTDQPQQTQALAAELETRGCKLIPYACDIADSADLARFLDLARVILPIRGVINAALALADAAWADMTLQQWKVPLAAKYSGSCNLHAAFAAEELDFFISLSSVTGVVGSHGQANYTAVSTFQDAQARWRVAATQKLPGVSIALGGVLGAGYIQQTAGVAERAARAGWRLHDIREVLWLIELAIRCPRAGQVIAGISQWTVDATAGQQTGASSSSLPAWRRERRFSALPVQNQGNNPAAIDRDEDMDDSVSLGERLLAAESDEARLTMLVDALRHRLADMFVLAPSAIDMAQPLAALGVDSLVAVELRNWLAASGVCDVSIFDVSQSQSLSALAKRLIAKIV